MRYLLAILTLCASIARADVPPWLVQPSKAVLGVQQSPGCYASGTVVNGVTVTVSRAGTASYVTNAGALADCAANQYRVTGWGMVGEAARGPNLFATPEAPAGQTITLGSTGFYSLSIWGPGSIAYTAGTATASGLPCTVKQGIPCIINASVAGTIVAGTPTGSVTFAQVEAGQWDTLPIRSGSRNADSITLTPMGLSSATAYCLGVDIVTEGAGRGWGTGNPTIVQLGASGANTGYLTGSYWSINDGTGAQKYITWAISSKYSVAHVCACNRAGTLTMTANGDDFTSAPVGAGTGLMSSPPSFISADGSVTAGAWFIRNVQVFQGPNAKQKCSVEAPDASAAGCFGDSITNGAGATYAYPQRLTYMMGPAHTAWNYGVNGLRTDQIASIVLQKVAGGRFGVAVVLGGSNDYAQSFDTGNVWARLQAIYDYVLAQGVGLVPVTIPPAKGTVWWTGGVPTAVQAVNAQILNYCSVHSLVCADAYTALDDGTGALQAQYDNGDHLHPNQAGTDLLASIIYTAGHTKGYW